MSKQFRLGVSTSSFIHAMPMELMKVMYETSRTGVLRKFDDHQNALMAKYTEDIMNTINSLEIEAMECYHSTVWDGPPLVQLMLQDPQVEFWSAHASYGSWIDPSSPDDSIREAALAAYCASVDMAADLGAKIVVAHPGTQTEYDVPKQTRLALSAETLAVVADHAAKSDIKLAIEPLPKNEPGNSLEEVIWITDQIDRPNVGINFDVNHLFPAADIPDMIRKAGNRILSVHVSDQDDQERHWLPFAGKIDWRGVLSALYRVDYSGPLIYETHVKGASSCEEIGRMIVKNYSHLITLAP